MIKNNNEKYIISEFYEFKVDKNLITEAEKTGGPLIMTGILQKADVENRNGRSYPYEILKREADKYMELIENNTAGGELDHPDCYSPDTSILTENGWKLFTELKNFEAVATLNSETNKLEYQFPEKITNQHYKGKMYSLKSKNIDYLVTPNHRFWITNESGKGFFKTAEELFSYRSDKWKISKKSEWIGEYEEFITIDGISDVLNFKHVKKEFKDKFSKPIKIKSEDFFSFLGIYLADGTSIGVNSGKYGHGLGYVVKVTQKKEDSKNKIRDLFTRLPFNFIEKKYKNGKVDFIISDIRLHKYLLKLGNSYNKFIPIKIKHYSSNLLSLLFEWFQLGDGGYVNQGKYKKESVFTTSKKLILDLQEILIKTGCHGNISEYQPKNKFIYDKIFIDIENEDGTLTKKITKNKRLIKSENSKIQYNLNISSTNNIYLDKRSLKIKEINNYDDTIHCVTVPNGIIYTMRNGKSSWAGNSAVVSLANVSHRVTEMWWQGKDLYGKVLVAEDTPAGKILKGLLKAGFMLGISSRGVGSVKSQGNIDVVQEDFELIAFDFVSSPSTPGAYLFKEGKEYKTLGVGMVPLNHGTGILTTENVQEKLSYYKKMYELSNNKFWKNI